MWWKMVRFFPVCTWWISHNSPCSPVCDSYVRPETLVRICDECNFGTYGGRCIICGAPGLPVDFFILWFLNEYLHRYIRRVLLRRMHTPRERPRWMSQNRQPRCKQNRSLLWTSSFRCVPYPFSVNTNSTIFFQDSKRASTSQVDLWVSVVWAIQPDDMHNTLRIPQIWSWTLRGSENISITIKTRVTALGRWVLPSSSIRRMDRYATLCVIRDSFTRSILNFGECLDWCRPLRRLPLAYLLFRFPRGHYVLWPIIVTHLRTNNGFG